MKLDTGEKKYQTVKAEACYWLQTFRTHSRAQEEISPQPLNDLIVLLWQRMGDLLPIPKGKKKKVN